MAELQAQPVVHEMWPIHPQRRGGVAGRELADLDAVELIDLETMDWTPTVNCVAVALEAQRLVEWRDRWLNPPEWVEWMDEPVPEALKTRTLTKPL